MPASIGNWPGIAMSTDEDLPETAGATLVVYCSLFPSSAQPTAGVFIRERMFKVAKRLPVVVVSPVPWFPLQGIIRWFKPHYRPMPRRHERQQGIDVYYPRFLAIPGVLRRLDGFFMALGARSTIRRLRDSSFPVILDSHFAFPDGYSASLLGRWLKLPFTITLRGTEVRHSRDPVLRPKLIKALERADEVITVANFLKEVVVGVGADPGKIQRVGNGVDTEKFFPIPQAEARRELGLGIDDTVMISVGGLVPRKGFHRVIELMPRLIKRYPNLRYLVVGGASPEGDFSAKLESMVRDSGLEEHVKFLGAIASHELKTPLSASDIFVLSTENEGWANVFLEAMACKLPVVTTRVGGNAEVVVSEEVGMLVDFGDSEGLQAAIDQALTRDWDRQKIRDYALANTWDSRVDALETVFSRIVDVDRQQ